MKHISLDEVPKPTNVRQTWVGLGTIGISDLSHRASLHFSWGGVPCSHHQAIDKYNNFVDFFAADPDDDLQKANDIHIDSRYTLFDYDFFKTALAQTSKFERRKHTMKYADLFKSFGGSFPALRPKVAKKAQATINMS